MTMVWRVSICPFLLSNRRPARTAMVRGAGGHCKMPPSEPTQGVGPAPRQGAGGGCTWAVSPAAYRTAAAIRNRYFMLTSRLRSRADLERDHVAVIVDSRQRRRGIVVVVFELV